MPETEYSCGMAEHRHADSCWSSDCIGSLLQENGLSGTTEQVYVVHQHNSNCYDADGGLICPLADSVYMGRYPNVTVIHQHDENCRDCKMESVAYHVIDESSTEYDPEYYVAGIPGGIGAGQPAGESIGITYHVHDAACGNGCERPIIIKYVAANGSGKVLICGKTEHVHDVGCAAGDPARDGTGVAPNEGYLAKAVEAVDNKLALASAFSLLSNLGTRNVSTLADSGGVTLGDLIVGSVVKLNVGGTPRNFIVIHKGRPSAAYDASCDGVWLLMQDIYENRAWNDSNSNDYANSSIHSYLNDTFFKLFDTSVRAQIKQVKIPYRPGSGYSKTISTGANGLSTKIFLLSATEITLFSGSSSSGLQYSPNIGTKLDYFEASRDDTRITKFNGVDSSWWTRSPECDSYMGDRNTVFGVGIDGGYFTSFIDNTCSCGIRPALVLPSSFSVPYTAIIGLSVYPTERKLAVGGAFTIVPTIVPGKANITKTEWSSSNPTIASVDEKGRVIGFEPGTATITCNVTDSCGVSKSEQCTVTVYTPSCFVLGEMAVGSIVKLKENGVPTDYIVVHQGRPSSLYDTSCDGTWLLRKNIAGNMKWGDNDNNIFVSPFWAYLNGEWLNRYDASTQAAIKQVKLPVRNQGWKPNSSDYLDPVNYTGANGLSCKVFALSALELGYDTSTSDGSKLAYFEYGLGDVAKAKRRSSTYYWTRTPTKGYSNFHWFVYADGTPSYGGAGDAFGIRPALILPSSLLVSNSSESVMTQGNVDGFCANEVGDGTSFSESMVISENGQDYRYRLSYQVTYGQSTNVLLYDEIENGSTSRFAGTVTGVDLSGYGDVPVDVYVQGDDIAADVTLPEAFDSVPGDWALVDDTEDYEDWEKVSHVALYSGDYVFDPVKCDGAYADVLMSSMGYKKNAPEGGETTALSITFGPNFRTESVSYDYVELYYKTNETCYKAGRWGGTDLANVTVNIPSDNFWLYWRTDSSNSSYYGFDVVSVTPYDEADFTAGNVASLPKYTVEETMNVADLNSAFGSHTHGNYGNDVNKMWHYGGTSSPHNAIRTIVNDVKVIERDYGNLSKGYHMMDGNQSTITIAYKDSEYVEDSMSGPEIPKTGGIGTMLFFVVGASCVVLVGTVFLTKKKK